MARINQTMKGGVRDSERKQKRNGVGKRANGGAEDLVGQGQERTGLENGFHRSSYSQYV